MLDRNLFSRALHWQLQRALPKMRCPNGEKKAQHAVPVSLRMDHAVAHAHLELWERLELCFQGLLGNVECSTPSPALLTPLWAATCGKHPPVATSLDLRVSSSWKKRVFPMFCCFGFMPCTSLPTLWNRKSVLLVVHWLFWIPWDWWIILLLYPFLFAY